MNFAEAADYRQVLDKLARREGPFTHGHHHVIGQMFRELRPAVADFTQVTYTQICKVAGACRQTVSDAIKAGVAAGILIVTPTRVRRAIGSRVRRVNGTNIYTFVIPKPEPEAAAIDPALLAEIEDVENSFAFKLSTSTVDNFVDENVDNPAICPPMSSKFQTTSLKVEVDNVEEPPAFTVADLPPLPEKPADKAPRPESRLKAWFWGRKKAKPCEPVRTVEEQIAELQKNGPS
jgi:hypothetical protein